MKKFVSVVIMLAMAVSMLAGCGKKEGSEAIKIGSIGPTTGDYAQYGLAVENALKMAAAEINALGGLQFEVLGEDDQGDPTMAVNAYNREMEQGMQVLLGTVTSGACAAVAAEAYNERVFLLTPSASNPAVNEGKDNVYQVCFTDPNQGASAALTIKNLDLGKKVAIIWNNAQDYSTSIYQSFIAKAAEIGLDVVVKDATFSDDSNADFSVQLQKAADAGADLVFLPIYYTPVAAIMQQAKAAGYSFKFFGVDGMDGLLSIDGFDTSLAEGSYMLTPFDANKADELTKSFVTNYKAKYGDVPNQFAADAYDAMYIFYAACKELGFTSETSAKDICEKMIPWMQKYSYSGLTGNNMVWGKDGCVSKAATAYVIRNGQYASVE
ncbi:MAG: ABC transporter substrate-binding protein [Lachnospiraceae bacterium]|nr:ABC transporter substrate-binding protein [Lachnospiraceae bacterium]